MKPLAGFDEGRPPNGPQAHDSSRELELSSPARVGATPFGDRPSSKPHVWQLTNELTMNITTAKVLPMC